EIIDLILEQLGLDEDTPSLFACLTVSKAFFPMARASLWRDRFLYPEKHGLVRWTVDKIPASPILRSLVRSMRICHQNWSFADGNVYKYEKDFGIVVYALERVNHLKLDFLGLREPIACPPAIRKWHIVSLKLSRFPVEPWSSGSNFVCSAKSCAFFEDFPMLIDVDLEQGGYQRIQPMSRCTREKHHSLPSPTSLTLRNHRRFSGIGGAILAGHLLSMKRLRSLGIVDCLFEPNDLLAMVSKSIKELVIDYTRYDIPLDPWEPFSFGTIEALLFSADARHARDTLMWWTRTFIHNSLNNVVQKVTIEIQLYLERDMTAPSIRFPKVWKELGRALLGLTGLRDLVIIHRPGYTERIGDRKDASIRAGVSQFLRSEMSDVTSGGHVRLTIIDRNV
ncbi:hypothetical protein CPB85DRAFT_1300844, partial [Mucidula mucida]